MVSKIGVEEGRMRRVQTRSERGRGLLSQINAFQEEKENLKNMRIGFKSLAHTQEWLFRANEEKGRAGSCVLCEESKVFLVETKI